MKKIIFVDIDGTIVDAPRGLKRPSKYTKYAFDELKKNHLVFIASGRNKMLLQDYITDLKPSGYILLNGAYGELNGHELFRDPMDPEHVKELEEYCLGNNYVYYRETIDDLFIGNCMSNLHDRFSKNWNIETYNNPDNGDLECYLLMPVLEDESQTKEFEEHFKDKLDVRHQYGFSSFDVGEYRTNKGTGLKKILECLHIKKEDSYSFGDGLNDLEMIKAAGTGIAMGNAFDLVKKEADEICEDVLDEGFYKALLRHKLIKPMDE